MNTSLSVGQIIRHLLAENEEIKKITKTVYPVVYTEAKLPYIFYQRLKLVTKPTKTPSSSDTVNVQVTCCHKDYAKSLELAEAVRAALDHVSYQDEESGLSMRSCYLTDADEDWEDDTYIQRLIFTIQV